MTDNEIRELRAQVAQMEARLALVEHRDAIVRIQNQYGFYLDNRMFGEVADLFCDGAPEIEIGQRGVYVGKERIRCFLLDVLGGGRWGLLKDEIIHHIQLQPVITVSEDGASAHCRCRALVQGNSPPGRGKMLLAEGVYENLYVREAGEWRIKRLWWVPTYYFQVDGFDKAVFDSGPPSADFPPDRGSFPKDEALGRRFPPFHYRHPFTGKDVPGPASAND